MSVSKLLLQMVIKACAVKLVSRDVCPLRRSQRILPDCIRTCGEEDYPPPDSLRSLAFSACVLPSRHPRILVNPPDLLYNLGGEEKKKEVRL